MDFYEHFSMSKFANARHREDAICQEWVFLRAENEQLKATIQNPDRHALQLEGKHPSPCAKFCEANAFLIQERGLRMRIYDLTKQRDDLLLALHAQQIEKECECKNCMNADAAIEKAKE